MKDNKILYRLSNDNKLLFINSNLIYLFVLLYYYNNNFNMDHMGDILAYEVLLFGFIFFIITLLLNFIFNKIFKDKKKVFVLLCFIIPFYFVKLTIIQYLIYIFCLGIVVLDLLVFKKIKLNGFISLISLIIIFLFSYNLFVFSYKGLYVMFYTKSYDNKSEFNVSSDVKPNIYYIHCDGMMSVEGVSKYFDFDDNSLYDYLSDNGYYINKDSVLVTGHRTQKSLVALFNPYYYDNFYKEFLVNYENSYLYNSKLPFYVSYYELEDKRLNNELFKALKLNDYTTIGIGEYNAHTSFITDYYYDDYAFDTSLNTNPNGELRYMNNISDNFKTRSYIELKHISTLMYNTMFFRYVDSVNYLDYDVIDYNDFDYSNFEYINKTKYWPIKAIVKSVDDSFKIDDSKFVFVDYSINHTPGYLDNFGNVLSDSDRYKYFLNYYMSNYKYSTYFLVELIDYIKSNDSDAIIILQADHGLHNVDTDVMMDYFKINNMEDVEYIRNSVISAIYIPDKYKNDDDKYLSNPLNISRYIVNNFVGDNYEYIEE